MSMHKHKINFFNVLNFFHKILILISNCNLSSIKIVCAINNVDWLSLGNVKAKDTLKITGEYEVDVGVECSDCPYLNI